MTDLYTLQSELQEYIEGKNEDITSHIVNTKDALAEHRLAAYYNAYRARLIEALAFDFPTTLAFLGEDKFDELVINYLKSYPSQYPSVRWVGKHLLHFINEQKHFETKAFLSELIEFEWKQSLVFDSPDDHQIFQLEDMTFPPEQWPDLYFKFTLSLQKIDLHFNVPSFWQAAENGEDLHEQEHYETPTQWLIWRQDLDPHWRSVDVHEAWALQQAQDGATFGDICEGLTEWIDAEHVAIVAAGFLKQWISDQIITSIILDNL